ncbi:hypothetical protein Tco_0157457 [Tanacetum coccineum]
MGDNKIDLLALDEGFSSKNYVRKFLRALHPKWRAKVTAIEESKDLSSQPPIRAYRHSRNMYMKLSWKRILKSIEAKRKELSPLP